MDNNPAFIGMPGEPPAPSATVLAMEERNRATHAAVMAAFAGKPQPPERPSTGDGPIPGFAAAEAAETKAEQALDVLQRRIAEAQAKAAAAAEARVTFGQKVLSGSTVSPGSFAQMDDATRGAEAVLAILREALPAAQADVTQATAAVDAALYAEARRLATQAGQRAQAAMKAADAARAAAAEASEAESRAQRFVGACANRQAWGARIAASREAGA